MKWMPESLARMPKTSRTSALLNFRVIGLAEEISSSMPSRSGLRSLLPSYSSASAGS
jgi:hypothetical protein